MLKWNSKNDRNQTNVSLPSHHNTLRKNLQLTIVSPTRMRAFFYRRQLLYYASLVCFSLLLWFLQTSLIKNEDDSFSRKSVGTAPIAVVAPSRDDGHIVAGQVKGQIAPSRDNNTEPSTEQFIQAGSVKTTTTDVVPVAVVACGGGTEKAVTLLKSAVLFSQGILLHVLAFADAKTKDELKLAITLLQKEAKDTMRDFTFEMRDVWFPPEEKKVWAEIYAPCSCQRLFFPTLLPEFDSILYIDTDAIFISEVKKLWNHFTKMNDVQWIAAVVEDEPTGDGWYNLHSKTPYYGKRGINTGVALLNLTRMRNFGLEKKAKIIQKKYANDLYWGDQDILNAILHKNPEFVYELPCSYNFRTSHCSCLYLGDCRCRSAETEGVKIVHGNRNAFFNSTSTFFSRIYNSFKEVSLTNFTPKDLCLRLVMVYDSVYGGSSNCVHNSLLFFKQICNRYR